MAKRTLWRGIARKVSAEQAEVTINTVPPVYITKSLPHLLKVVLLTSIAKMQQGYFPKRLVIG
eukprot:5853794-Amphidinium_carterae.1